MKNILIIFICICFPAFAVHAANTPCSGKKGGISHCVGSTFVCNDGSTSASTKDCSTYMGATSRTNSLEGSSATSQMAPTSGNCSCRSGSYCIGPRGGHYCYTDSGRKNYLKH